MVAKIQTDLSRFSDAELLRRSDYILTSMTGNPAFTDPLPSITEVQAVFSKFNSDVIAASGRDNVLIAEKNKSRKALLNLLSRLGMHVMCVAHGDEALLATTGFQKVKAPETGFISSPESIVVKNGTTSGQLVSRAKPVKHVAIYAHEFTRDYPNVSAVWTATRSSKSYHVFSNLEPGTKYWVRVAAIRGNDIAYSQVASMYVQ